MGLVNRIFGILVDRGFEFILEHEFLHDLVSATKLKERAFTGLTEEQTYLLQNLKSKYRYDGLCPSPQYKYASDNLQSVYDMIHTKICEVLYD